MRPILGAVPVLLLPLIAFAAAPPWTIVPTTQTTLAVSSDEVRTIQYRVTNQSRKPQRLEMKAISGIAQRTDGGGLCDRVFALQSRQSCLLTLEVDGGRLTGPVSGGPAVCAEGNPAHCYQPQSAGALDITRRP